MGNMSYCRFENTAQDLQDCCDHMDDNDLSESELRHRRRLIKICVSIAVNSGHEVDMPVVYEDEEKV